MQIEILPHRGGTKYLGRFLTFRAPQDAELTNRINNAWRKFGCHKQELTSKCYPLRQRLRLFEATVSATALYGSSAWTLTKQQEDRLRKSQRQMLRKVLGAGCMTMPSGRGDATSSSDEGSEEREPIGDLEPWVEWLKRTTRYIEDQLGKANIEDWVVAYRRHKWKVAGKASRASTNPEWKWSQVLMDWLPASVLQNFRRSGRPKLRWDEEFGKVIAERFGEQCRDWREVACHEETWELLESEFANQRWI